MVPVCSTKLQHHFRPLDISKTMSLAWTWSEITPLQDQNLFSDNKLHLWTENPPVILFIVAYLNLHFPTKQHPNKKTSSFSSKQKMQKNTNTSGLTFQSRFTGSPSLTCASAKTSAFEEQLGSIHSYCSASHNVGHYKKIILQEY